MAKDKIKSPELEFEETFEYVAGKDNPPVDTTLLKMIEAGDIPFTDDFFLNLVKESPGYLHTKPFQDKLAS